MSFWSLKFTNSSEICGYIKYLGSKTRQNVSFIHIEYHFMCIMICIVWLKIKDTEPYLLYMLYLCHCVWPIEIAYAGGNCQHEVILIMPWLCVDHMIQQGVWPMGSSYPDSLAKSRPTGKIQTHWLGHKVVHIVTRNIKN